MSYDNGWRLVNIVVHANAFAEPSGLWALLQTYPWLLTRLTRLLAAVAHRPRA